MLTVPPLRAADEGERPAAGGAMPARLTVRPANAVRFVGATAAPFESVSRLSVIVDEMLPGRISDGDAVPVSLRNGATVKDEAPAFVAESHPVLPAAAPQPHQLSAASTAPPVA